MIIEYLSPGLFLFASVKLVVACEVMISIMSAVRGFGIKSWAPSFMAFTASLTWALNEIKMTGRDSLISFILFKKS